MEKIYQQILKEALPYYEKGRNGDVEHIKWLVKVVPKYVDESEIDFSLLIPVIILHDVGYAKVPEKNDPYNLDNRKLHSEEGAKITEKILRKLNYPQDKIAKIKKFVLHHDDWAFGESFKDEPVLKVFNNFDFIWMTSKKGFQIVRKFLGLNKKEFYQQIPKYYKKNNEEGRTFFNKNIELFYKKLMKDRKKEIF